MMATELAVHECGCAACRAGDHADRDDHRQLNLLLSRLDEQQRRWVAGREAKRLGHGGLKLLAEITGLLCFNADLGLPADPATKALFEFVGEALKK